MEKNIYKILFSIIVFLTFISPVFPTQLPGPVVTYIKEKIPDANIRFDGLVELPGDVEYLPVLPVVFDDPNEPAEVVQTIPAEMDLSEYPDMILFSNNFALLKIIRAEGELPTVINSQEMPLKVKLGILPQDLVVPKGLVLPYELKVILGDLKIPLKEKTDKEGEIAFYNKKENTGAQGEKPVNLLGKTTENVYNIPELEFLNKKKLYTINYKDNKLYVLDSHTGRTVKIITLPSVPIGMLKTLDERYILLAGLAAGKVFVVDTLNDVFVKNLEVGKFPASIVDIPEEQKAYVANKLSATISEIDLKNMKVVREIPVNGFPDNLYVADNEKFIFYSDYKTGNVYQLNIKTANSTLLLNDKNIAKLGQYDRYLFSLSRTANTLTVFDLKKGEIIKKTETGQKPMDYEIVEKMGRILVVCAGSAEINIIDVEDFEIAKSIPLKGNGFPGNIEVVHGTGGKSHAIITDYDAYEVVIYNIDLEKVDGYIPVNHTVGSIIFSD